MLILWYHLRKLGRALDRALIKEFVNLLDNLPSLAPGIIAKVKQIVPCITTNNVLDEDKDVLCNSRYHLYLLRRSQYHSDAPTCGPRHWLSFFVPAGS